MPSTIHIAITGGGLTAFKEAGMAVGVTRNALTSLDLNGKSAAQALESAGAVPQKAFRIALAQGPNQGRLIGEIDVSGPGGKRLTSIVHRADFLRELLAEVPKDRMHASKKLASIDKSSPTGPITLYFTDGTTHEYDILVGADGIHSTVRKLILGADDPAASARNSGWLGIMVLKPFEEAKSCIESLNIEDAREYGFVGDGTYLMWNLLSHGKLLQFVATGYDEHVENDWTRMVTADEIKRLYQHWPEHLRKAILEVRNDC
ncbi:hypothetical protein N0V82_010130 [Gnomoniopsis sp. IMI 355080]|nr:hypothetical protein N0V82_010130 [Gnomoniopsis sp. IMI 355080]